MKFKDMTIGKKISGGFGVVLILLMGVGTLSFFGVNGIVRNAGQVIDGNKLDGVLAQREVDHLNWANRVNALLTDDHVTALDVQTDDHQCGFGQWLYGQGRKDAEALVPSLKPLLKSIEAPHRHLHESAITIGELYKPVDRNWGAFLREKKNDHLIWTQKIKDAFIKRQQTPLDIQMNPTQCGLGKWLYAPEMEARKASDPELGRLLTEIQEPHRRLHESAHKLQELMISGDFETALVQYERVIGPAADEACGILDRIIAWHDAKMKNMQDASHVYATQTQSALKTTRELIDKIRHQARQHIMTDEVMLAAANRTKLTVSSMAVVALVCGICLAIFLARGIVIVLRRISAEIGDGANQVAAAANQVAGASQSLAEGASQQAASIEESSSGLEELSSMTRRNAENARQADSLMKSANQVVEEADHSMDELNASMGEILKASQETSKIIKTIDEIAFQTNLLALNAAVEAARAGEAGAGFAVVADEVRNLAMRAAEAAKNTASLIEGTVRRVDEGARLVTRTNEAFKEVSGTTVKVGNLVAEIATASDEQASGVGQINNAVTEMDKVTQQNAANSEESASSAEEMSAQALQMAQFAKELQSMVNGNNGHTAHQADVYNDLISAPESGSKKQQRLSMAKIVNRAGVSQVHSRRPESAQPANLLIPLDDNEENLRAF